MIDDHASIPSHEQVSSEYSPFTSCYSSTYLLAFRMIRGKKDKGEESGASAQPEACADDDDERGIYIHHRYIPLKSECFFFTEASYLLRSSILSFQNSVNNGCIGYNGPLSPFALRFVRNRTGATTRTPTNQCSCHFMIIMMPVVKRH